MDTQSESLNLVLRCQMTAVHQQFIHFLALRDWGDDETADRILKIDMIDFPNAMRIIDYLVEKKTPISMGPGDFTPGTDRRSILLSEQTMERRLSAAIEKAICTDDSARALVSTAEAPRGAYAAWLTDRLNGTIRDGPSANLTNTETASLNAHLIALIEQSMVHAFVHWHGGDRAGADAAWATSGAAMMHLTELVHDYAARGTVPGLGESPAPQLASEPAVAHDLDRELAELCAQEAAKAAEGCAETAIAELCRKISDRCRELSHWEPGQTHPATRTNPPAFSSFEASLKNKVWPK